ncbi:hypothetical protein NST33_18380 [Paenibacillus sp. FSL L8-0435]|uniref:hypothetical protein n=1 Tax=Paenibacillus sp. FSL L8-0435 TaxID=2954618 RepID=UPI0030DBFC94
MSDIKMEQLSCEIHDQIHRSHNLNMNSAINYGVAMVLVSVFDWCDECENFKIRPSPRDIKKAMYNWIHSEDEVKEMFFKMYSSK